ncbi:MAG: hypothetical protein HY201_03385 [Nitrospirae bacterium]|nr:hypothetical protein [Candidatus Troglogloeales bacterium]
MRPKSNNSDEIAGPVQIITDKTTNQLIITASDEDYQIVEKTIKSLDQKRRQVYVEAVVMEMSAEKSREIGTDLTAIFGAVPSVGSKLSILGAFNTTDIAGQAELLVGSKAIGIKGVDIRPVNARTFLKALQTSSDVNVLSTPQILTSDKQKAELSVAENVPFKGATNNVAGGAQTVTIERKDVGVILRLTPTVMENSQIKLDLYQEISSVIRDTVDGPVTAKRSAATIVVVRDGQTAIIGGLLGDSVKVTERKVPILGDIPILGYFFKLKTKSVEKTNLLIFVTPYLMPDSEDKNAIDPILKKNVEGSMTFMQENKLPEQLKRNEFLKGMINPPK